MQTNFLSVKKRGEIILILIFSLLFKTNYEEFAAPPAVKRAMATANSEECTPPPSKKARDDEAARSVSVPMQSGQKTKRQWATRVENSAIQASDIDTASMQVARATVIRFASSSDQPGLSMQPSKKFESASSDQDGGNTPLHAMPGTSDVQPELVSVYIFFSFFFKNKTKFSQAHSF